MTPLAIILALLIGLTLGLLGGGGSILTVPALVFAVGVDPKTAIVMSLPIVGGAALSGAIRHWRLGNIDLSVAMPFGVAAMLGAGVGAWIGRVISGRAQLVILAAVMLGAAFSMVRRADRIEERKTALRVTPQLLLIAVATGTLTGLVGIGGGFLLVPALVLLAGEPMKKAIGTSLLIIAMNAAAAFLGYLGVVDVPWMLVLYFGGLTAIGLAAGTALLPRVPQRMLSRAFAMLLVVVAASIFWKNLVPTL